jgi:hypothetical protein
MAWLVVVVNTFISFESARHNKVLAALMFCAINRTAFFSFMVLSVNSHPAVGRTAEVIPITDGENLLVCSVGDCTDLHGE